MELTKHLSEREKPLAAASLKSLNLEPQEWQLFIIAVEKLRRDFNQRAANGKKGKTGSNSHLTKAQQARRQNFMALWDLIDLKAAQPDGSFRLDSAETELFAFAADRIREKQKQKERQKGRLKILGQPQTPDGSSRGGAATRGMKGKGKGVVGRKPDSNPSPQALAKRRQREREAAAALTETGEN